MRIGSWLLLIVSFLCGLVSAFIVAYFTFDAKPIQVVDKGPTVKILVAQKEIPIGAEIAAEHISFEDVPISEIPAKALTNFMQAYKRRPAYPIPVGCPICEDLLIVQEKDASDSVRFLPAGSQVVSLEVEQFGLGDTFSEIDIPLSKFLSVGDKIDIRVIPGDAPKGEYIERKNQVLRAFASKKEQWGELVLENVGIYNLVSKQIQSGGKQIQTLSLLLERGQAEKLTAAARDGKLRVIPRRDRQTDPDDTNETTDNTMARNVSDETKEDLHAKKDAELSASPLSPEKRVRLIDSATQPSESTTEMIVKMPIREMTVTQPVSPVNPNETASTSFRPVISAENKADAQHFHSGAHVSFVTPNLQKERKETEKIADNRMSPSPEAELFVPSNEGQATPFRKRPTKVLEVGLSYSDGPNQEESEFSRTPSYSPFNTQSRIVDIPEEELEDLPQPLPLRSRPVR